MRVSSRTKITKSAGHAAHTERIVIMAWKQISPPFTLTQNTQYSALLHLSFIEKAVATPDMITSKFTAVGFANVSVDDSDTSNPRVLGTWPLPDQDDVSFPSEVKTVWEWDVPVPAPTTPGDVAA